MNKKTKTHETTARDAELYNFYQATVNRWFAERRHFTHREAVTWVLENCHPRYHTTFDYTMRHITHTLENRNSIKSSSLRGFWEEMAAFVVDYRMRHPRCTLSRAVTELLANGRASRYFISYERARKIIRYEGRRRKAGKA